MAEATMMVVMRHLRHGALGVEQIRERSGIRSQRISDLLTRAKNEQLVMRIPESHEWQLTPTGAAAVKGAR